MFSFFQSRELPVVDMRMRHADFEAMLHTKERYENYFKRRIATIVSKYCEHQTNECPGTALRLQEAPSAVSSSGQSPAAAQTSSPPPFEIDSSVLYANDDDPEPLLTQAPTFPFIPSLDRE
ncbi:hypothetical protein WR25_01877 [Diploscapter pachys]|uniref:Uncharacterized protein n=1 Tax=Diploscapter pachys TaxID=2018661 RepID=A0A2A2KWI1_9BILA|nr:hypothetical protein WR25_01877 [Diploscapter pachys]